MYVNCHIKEISRIAHGFPDNFREWPTNIDQTFYPRFVVLPKKGLPCNTECECPIENMRD